jgi:hypothetical protein
LAAPQLPLGNKLEAGLLEVVSLDAAFGCNAAVDKSAERVPRNADDALILAYADAELDRLPIGVPPGILGKAEKHDVPSPSNAVVPILFYAE